MYIVGHKEAVDLIDNNKLNDINFFIIKGPVGFGKTYLTKYMANHFNMNYIMLDNKVDDIRELVKSSNKNNNCLYHLKDFDRASPAAKASLLKISEETPKGVKIVVTTSAYNLVDTLLSRAYVINIHPYSQEHLDEYIKLLSIDDDIISTLKDEFQIMLTPSLLYEYQDTVNIKEIIELVRYTIDKINDGLRVEHISIIANSFWKEDKGKVKIYLETLLKSHRLVQKKSFLMVRVVSDALYHFKNTALTNFKQLINNMLMELI